jgi:ABC-type nitrate/sulfonate/bicarbonate transport system permease component
LPSIARLRTGVIRPPDRNSCFNYLTSRYATPITRCNALIIFLMVWELVYRLGLVNPLFTSSPSRIVAAGYGLFATGEIWNDLRVSGIELAVGYVAAIVVGIPLGFAAGWYKRLFFILNPFMDTLNAVPRVTFMPVIIIWFGIGVSSKIALVFLGAVITIVINTTAGVKMHDVRFVRVAKSFGASEAKIFKSVVLPGTVPFIFSGLKIGAGQALINVVVGEFYAATMGIGYFISVSGNSFEIDESFAGIVVVTASGLVLVGILDRIERHFDRWRPRIGAA